MFPYLVSRVTWTLILLLVMSGVVYLLLGLVPGDAMDLFVAPTLSEADRARFRQALGLDQPVHIQYGKWLGQVLRGNLGFSFYTGQPVVQRIGERFGATFTLASSALIVTLIFAIPLGVAAASRPHGLSDRLAGLVGLLGVSTPSFFLGLLLIYVFALRLGWLPIGGLERIGGGGGLSDRLRHLVLPTVALSLYMLGPMMRQLRAAMIEALQQDYIRTALAKGVSPFWVLYKHALRTAFIPVITLVGLELPYLLGGALVVEQVFNWPGLGKLTLEAVFQRDYPVIMAMVLVSGLTVQIGAILTDLGYLVADPRIRRS